MKRKVSKIGPSTLMVSLPSKWAKKYGVKAGDEVEIEEDKSSLVLATAPHAPEKKEIFVELPEVKDYLGRFLCAPYVKGYDVIGIKFKDKEVYDQIIKTSKFLMGFEIVESGENSCKLVNISTKLEQNFDILLSRLFSAALTFTKELFDRLKNQEPIEPLLEYEWDANRLTLFCRRVVQTGRFETERYTPYTLYSLVGHLEEMTDCLRHIIDTAGNKKIKLDEETIKLFDNCINAQEINFKIFNQLLKGETTVSQIELFKKHKRIRREVFRELDEFDRKEVVDYFKTDKINSYICTWLMAVIELSHHISEELVY